MEQNPATNNGQNQPTSGPGGDQSLPAQAGKKLIKVEGRVLEALPNAFFKVALADGSEVTGFLSGKMRLNRIKILPGDRVNLEMTPYDMKKGRIVYRLK